MYGGRAIINGVGYVYKAIFKGNDNRQQLGSGKKNEEIKKEEGKDNRQKNIKEEKKEPKLKQMKMKK